MQSTLTWGGCGESYSIPRCVSSENETTTIYQFSKESCRKQNGHDYNALLQVMKQTRNEMMANLTHGDWVMFESPEPNVQPFWIGRAVSKEEWGNACWYKNETGTRQMLAEGVPLHRGEYAINVQWYTLRDAGSPLEYVIDAEHPIPFPNNYATLVLAGFGMVQIVGKLVRVPRQRSVRMRNDEFGYAQPQLNLQTRAGDWFRSDFGNVYRMSEKTSEEGIQRCGLWSGRH
jgi:hypothetical protein